MNEVIQGSLFSYDFLQETIRELEGWDGLDDGAVAVLESRLIDIFNGFPSAQSPSESRTEDDLIWPVLATLGWESSVRQQNLSIRGRDDVPDGLLFADEATKARASEHPEQWRAYQHGLVVVESKRWQRPLDRRSGRRGEETAPSTQMLRYLRRVDDLTGGTLRWGMLTNGARWRLYFQGARSVSEQFFEINLAAILNLPGHNEGLFALSPEDRRHWLKVFVFLFVRDAFLPGEIDPRTVHQRALDEGRYHEERVAASLSDLVFGQVFPQLVRGIAAEAPDAPLQDVREAALVLLYRLLFILYAEDRSLLPVRDARYDDYGLREKVRGDVRQRKDRGDVFSDQAARYWSTIDDLCRAIDGGDSSIGLPPYNGGLFDRERTPLLADIRLRDDLMADVIDALSFEQGPGGRRYINFRDLSVQQLGSIYERLLEHEVVDQEGVIAVRPNLFARKGSGSYYTPDDLVGLIIRETLDPLVQRRMGAFADMVAELEAGAGMEDRRVARLRLADPAERLLELKICDPAMGSGHFLVSLVDYLADQVINAMAEAEAAIEGYVSPLSERIEIIRTTILANAEERGWTVNEDQLDDRHIIRRMVLKRCVYGVDKNPMAVELAKVALWLHTFTVGAPLSFIDHHLRCGDSLFGSWVRSGIDKASAQGSPLLLHGPITRATSAAASMQAIEGLTDAEIAEAHRSADIFEGVKDMTSALDAFLSLVHAFDWLDIRGREDRAALHAFFDGQFGDPINLALGRGEIVNGRPEARRFAEFLEQARMLVAEERFLNWQVVFPGVWSDWQSNRLQGGFDAVIGNPPWDRMKLQQVEWFALRRRDIAMAQRASDRTRMIADLRAAGDPLAEDFEKASDRAEASVRVARASGDYPLLSGGDVNLYSLFVERAMAIVKSDGMIGLLTPSGIASDKTAARFFQGVATEGRLKALYDFENRRTRFDAQPFFPDVDSRFKFCAFVASPAPTPEAARCAFFLQDISEIENPDRCFPLSAEDFARVNPNTGTAPIFRTRRDADLTTAIYGRLPVLVDRSGGGEVKAWPVKYATMFHMTNDSGLFRTRRELEDDEGAYPTGGNRFGSPSGDWVPLYEGKMVQAYDHRAASVVVNAENQHRPAQPMPATAEQHGNPDWLPDPQFWVAERETTFPEASFLLAFKDVTATTNIRSMIAAFIPQAGVGNTLPIILNEAMETLDASTASVMLANLNAMSFDFVARQKIQGQHLNWFIVEQLPVVPPDRYDAVSFGQKTAGEIVREAVLELTYTAHDMAPFARDMGHVDDAGEVRPPFVWDDERRLRLRAKLDALYFHLYGVTDRDDVRYVYSTFPIVERQETAEYGSYRSRDLCLAYMNALAAGNPDAVIDL
ncbi:MAG TPA: restriction endonuclease [Rhodospirillaceae bacterium]|nr:restriction endonuclease [Magnetovibrio sp.]HBT43156.1 restriction endonuclease [Rhodospirillaceae bacterium]